MREILLRQRGYVLVNKCLNLEMIAFVGNNRKYLIFCFAICTMELYSPFKKSLVRMAKYHEWAYDVLLKLVSKLREDEYRKNVGLFFHSVHGTLNRMYIELYQKINHRRSTASRQALVRKIYFTTNFHCAFGYRII